MNAAVQRSEQLAVAGDAVRRDLSALARSFFLALVAPIFPK
jgi:hypothetical protein